MHNINNGKHCHLNALEWLQDGFGVADRHAWPAFASVNSQPVCTAFQSPMASYLSGETVLGPSRSSLHPMLSIAGRMRGNKHCAGGATDRANWNVKSRASSSRPSTQAHLGEWEKPMKILELKFSKRENSAYNLKKGPWLPTLDLRHKWNHRSE